VNLLSLEVTKRVLERLCLSNINTSLSPLKGRGIKGEG
jgi:hypothetical protein